MSNYYVSKCCGAEAMLSAKLNGTGCCLKCGDECEVTAMLDTPNDVPKADCTICGREGGHIMPIKEPAYIGGVDLSVDWKDRLQTEFMEFWDSHKDSLGLGGYSDEITRFWFGKMETQKSEIISLIYSMVLNKEVDDVEASKIVNKIRNEKKMCRL